MTTTLDIVRAAWDDSARLVPCLWGPPRRGKTWGLLATARSYTGAADRVLVWRPALDLPEDMGGLLRVRGGRGYYSTPPGLPAACIEAGGLGWVLIIDEVDKAKSDTLCTLLSLLDHQRSIRDVRLPALHIACAGNAPETPLPEPLIGRLLHLRYPEAADVAARQGHYDAVSREPGAAWLAEVSRVVLTIPRVALPARVSGEDSLAALQSWCAWPAAADEAVRQRIVEGLFRSEDVPSILAALERDELAGDHVEDWVRTAPLAVVVARLHAVVAEAEPGMAGCALVALEARADADNTGEVRRAYAALLACPPALAALGPCLSSDVPAKGATAWAAALRSGVGGGGSGGHVYLRRCGHVCSADARRARTCAVCGGTCKCATCAVRS